MGVRTNILAITPLAAETAQCASNGQDLPGMLNMLAQKIADAIQVANAINDTGFMPSGTNKTTIATAITSLT